MKNKYDSFKPKRFNLRSFQLDSKNKANLEHNLYISSTHLQQANAMNTHFSTFFSDVCCSSLFYEFISAGEETGQISDVYDVKNESALYGFSDITLRDDFYLEKMDGNFIIKKNESNNLVQIRDAWINPASDQLICFEEFHGKNKPLFLKLSTKGHSFCAFIFPDKKICEIWNTGMIPQTITGFFSKLLCKFDYKVKVCITFAQTNLNPNLNIQIKQENQKKKIDTYCQTWVFLHAFLRFKLKYSVIEIILYILSFNFNDRIYMINSFQTQLSNDPSLLEHIDIVKDMKKKNWKNKYSKIMENLQYIFGDDEAPRVNIEEMFASNNFSDDNIDLLEDYFVQNTNCDEQNDDFVMKDHTSFEIFQDFFKAPDVKKQNEKKIKLKGGGKQKKKMCKYCNKMF